MDSIVKVRKVLPFLDSDQDQEVQIYGWVKSVRSQSKKIQFVDVWDGTGYAQCCFFKKESAQVDTWLPWTTVCLKGRVKKLPEGKTSIGGDYELSVSEWTVFGHTKTPLPIRDDTEISHRMQQRHLDLRTDRAMQIQRDKSELLWLIRTVYREMGYQEVIPPEIVGGQCEGGAQVFPVDFYGKKASLTQSSQMYLEVAVPILGKSVCFAKSFRGEKSSTRRHLAEFYHIEIEIPFITFEDLLDETEQWVKKVIKGWGKKFMEFLDKPFMRMDYREFLKYLDEHDIRKEDGTAFEFGDDVPEAPERKAIDMMGEPVFLCRFPVPLKSFYMKEDSRDPAVTESFDLLFPGCGEVFGGSMRETDEQKLRDKCKIFGVKTTELEWYLDLRKWGAASLSGGYGMGFERFCMVFLGVDHIRDIPLIPRYAYGHTCP